MASEATVTSRIERLGVQEPRVPSRGAEGVPCRRWQGQDSTALGGHPASSTAPWPLQFISKFFPKRLWLGPEVALGNLLPSKGKAPWPRHQALPGLAPRLRVGGMVRGRHSSCHSSSSSTICPFPALAANPNHFLLCRLQPLPAAWPCADPEGQRTVLSCQL